MKQIAIVMVLLLSSLLVSAQDADKAQKKAIQIQQQEAAVQKKQAAELAKLSKQLSLTPEQKKAIAKLQKELNAATKAFREADKKDPSRKELKSKMKQLRNGYTPSVKALLTAKQKHLYQEILEKEQNAALNANSGPSHQSGGGGQSEESGEE